ncbi:MAG: magnesium transporter [Thermomicrobiales bacterium]|nr:magnesium transporter [Thermomicrobiales bacterium]
MALSFFIPLLIGTGGNVGTQVTTALDTPEWGSTSLASEYALGFLKEVRVGLLLGLTMGVVWHSCARLLHVGVDIGVVIAVTVLSISIWSAAVASLLPLVLTSEGLIRRTGFRTTHRPGRQRSVVFSIAKTLLHL